MYSPSSAFHWILSVPGANERLLVVSRYLKSEEVAQRARYLRERDDKTRRRQQRKGELPRMLSVLGIGSDENSSSILILGYDPERARKVSARVSKATKMVKKRVG